MDGLSGQCGTRRPPGQAGVAGSGAAGAGLSLKCPRRIAQPAASIANRLGDLRRLRSCPRSADPPVIQPSFDLPVGLLG